MATHTLSFTHTLNFTDFTDVTEESTVSFDSAPHRAGDFLFRLKVITIKTNRLVAFLSVRPAVSSSLEWSVVVSTLSIVLKAHHGKNVECTSSLGRTFSQKNQMDEYLVSINLDRLWHGNGHGACLVFEVTVKANLASNDTNTALQFKQWLSGGALQRMWNDMAYPDLYFIAQGEEIQCHRVVVAMASAVFDQMLSSDFLEGHRHQVCLQHVSASVVRSAVGFIYTGQLLECNDYEAICGLLDFANMYQLPSLANVCASRLIEFAKKANIRHVLHLLHLHKDASPEMEDHLNTMLSKVKEDDLLFRAVCLDDCGTQVKSQPEQSPTKTVSVQTCKPVPIETSVAVLNSGLCAGDDDIASVSQNEDSDANCTFLYTSVASAAQTESVAPFTPSWLDHNKRRSNERRHVAACALSMVYASLAAKNRKSHHAPSKITLVGFNPFSKEFEDALLQSDIAQRLVTRGVDVKPSWAHGAKIFVDNVEKASLEQAGVTIRDLRHWHVLVLDEDVPWVESIMRKVVGRKSRVRSARSVYLDVTSALPGDLDVAEQIEGKGESPTYDVYVCRTFVHVPKPKMISPRTCYTQSSPDPHVEDDVEIDRRRLNPRMWGRL